ncbi:pheromone processing endoprotease [Rhizophlyctis rosea]|nr:pheromone processing endoprotease [Rhizophlyctis rosea]
MLLKQLAWTWSLAGLASLSAVLGTPNDSTAVHPSIPPNDHTNFHYIAIKLSPTSASPDPLPVRAQTIGTTLGYHYLGRVGELDDYFLYATPKHPTADETAHHGRRHAKRFTDLSGVVWAEPQVPKRRLFRRDVVPREERAERGGPIRIGDIMQRLNISDPGFDRQWHLLNTEQIGNDLNVTAVWEQGITGWNATVCFVDDGLDYESEDLKDNFFAEGSYDFNDHRALPKPMLLDDRHGTRCAGEVAAVRNNVCGVGVAYNAKVSGVRILSGSLTEADEAASINYAMDKNHIYSCSWGPADDGRSMEAPPQIVADAFVTGIKKGRGGLGSIYVFASGNGGASYDNCNFDGYTNSIYTITVGAIDRNNNHPSYSEACSATMIVMYSSGAGTSAIYTTDWHQAGECTDRHGGTSAAAPLASGVYSLVLQIRPDLTWRDFQHLTVRTAVQVNPTDSSWALTAAGRPYSHKFGYGKLDAWAIVEAAKTYTKVAPQTNFTSSVVTVNKDIPNDDEGVTSHVLVSESDLKGAGLGRLEHVTVTVDITHQRRGDVVVKLTSPGNVESRLAMGRAYDADGNGFRNWTFMSVAHWDENPVGAWLLTVIDNQNPNMKGKWNHWYITFWGESSNITIPSTPIPKPTAVPATSSPSSVSAGKENDNTTTPQPSSSSHAVIWVFFVLFAVGVAGVFLWRRRKGRGEWGKGYEFGPLDSGEVEAAFDEDEDEGGGLLEGVEERSEGPVGGGKGGGGGGGKGGGGGGEVLFDRFVVDD